MGYVTYDKTNVEGFIGSGAVEFLRAIEHIRQVQAFVTGLGGNPQAVLEGLGFSPDEATRIVTAYSGSNGLVKIANVFEGTATQASAVDFKPQVLAVVGPSFY